MTGSVFPSSEWAKLSLEVSSTSNWGELEEQGADGTSATIPCWEESIVVQEKEQGFGKSSFKRDFEPMSDMGGWVSKRIGSWGEGQTDGGGAGQKLHG